MSEDSGSTSFEPEVTEAPTQPEPPAQVAPADLGTYPTPTKKSKKGLWTAIAIVLALLVVGGAYFGYTAYTAAQEQQVYDEALDELEAAAEKFDEADPSTKDLEAFAREAKPMIAEFRDAVAQARGKIEPLSDSEKKTTALKALKSLRTALDDLYAAMDDVADSGKLEAEIDAMFADIKSGDDADNAATKANNSDKWDEAAANVQAATQSYDAANAKATALDAKRPGVGFADVLKRISMSRAMTEKNLAMSGYGRSGKIDAYNKTIEEAENIQKELAQVPDPAFVDDPELLEGDVSTILDDAEDAIEKAMKTLKRLR